MSECEYVANGVKCRFPGTFSEGLKGEGNWKCCFHRQSDVFEGEEAVNRSLRWEKLPNKAAAWVAMRRREVYSGKSPVVEILRPNIRPFDSQGALSQWVREPGADECEKAA